MSYAVEHSSFDKFVSLTRYSIASSLLSNFFNISFTSLNLSIATRISVFIISRLTCKLLFIVQSLYHEKWKNATD